MDQHSEQFEKFCSIEIKANADSADWLLSAFVNKLALPHVCSQKVSAYSSAKQFYQILCSRKLPSSILQWWQQKLNRSWACIPEDPF